MKLNKRYILSFSLILFFIFTAGIISSCSSSIKNNVTQLTYVEKNSIQLVSTKPDGKTKSNDEDLERESFEQQVKLKKQQQRLLLEEEKRREELSKEEEKKKEDLKNQEMLKKQEDIKKQEPVNKPQDNGSQQAQANKVSTLPESNRLIDKIKSIGSSQQVILVQANSFGTCRVKISTYEKFDGKWNEIHSNISGVIGINGFSTNRHEGDLTTPVGTFSIPYLFGWGGNAGFKMSYRASGTNDYWVSDSVPERYNVWIHQEGGPDSSWKDYETLGPKQPLYKYAAVINFNMGPNKIIGKGSGMFLHITPLSGGGTLGCTAMPENNLIQVLKWLDPSKNPIIIQGPTSELNKM